MIEDQPQRLILWFRNDLRLHDNIVLDYAVQLKKSCSYAEIVPVFCFDPRFFTESDPEYLTKRCGFIRAKFMLESVLALRNKLESIGVCLLISMEKPEHFIPALALPKYVDNKLIQTRVVFQREAIIA